VRLSDMGEFGLIHRFRSLFSPQHSRINLGIGDDAALIKPHEGWETVFTTDTLVESVHYDLSYTPYDALGWKALSINLSDVAAMGGLPICAVVSLGISDSWTSKAVDNFCQGLQACGHSFQCPIVGGDTVRVPRDSVITVTVMGEVESGQALRRTGAQPGDCLCVTGPLGNARAGLEMLTGHINIPAGDQAISHFLRPVPRIQESRKLVKHGGITSMIDISDGLSSEIHHICRESDVGCRVFADRIPVACSAERWIEAGKQMPIPFVLESGEEYELLYTIHSESYQKLEAEGSQGVSACYKIGDILEASEGIFLEKDGKQTPLNSKGWEHFH